MSDTTNDQADSISASARLEFAQKEYQEAAKLYSLGVQAGQDLMRQYLSGNGVLAAFFGVAVGFARQFPLAAKWALMFVPIFGILASGIVLSMVPHSRNLLNACSSRCCELEKQFGGRLYKSIVEVSESSRFGTRFSLGIMCFIFILFWIAMIFVGTNVVRGNIEVEG